MNVEKIARKAILFIKRILSKVDELTDSAIGGLKQFEKKKQSCKTLTTNTLVVSPDFATILFKTTENCSNT